MVYSKTIFFILCTFATFSITQGRSRFRRLSDDDAPLSSAEAEKSQESEPESLREAKLFRLTGPSLDFQRGSITPASLPNSFRTSQLSRGVDFDDYNEYGSRFHVPSKKNKEKVINVIPYKKSTEVTTNPNTLRTSTSSTTLAEAETTTSSDPEDFISAVAGDDNTTNTPESESGDGDDVDAYDDAPTSSKAKNLEH